MPNPVMIDTDATLQEVSEPYCEGSDDRTATIKLKLQIDFDTPDLANKFIAALGAFLAANAIIMPDGIKPTFVINGEMWGWQDSPTKEGL